MASGQGLAMNEAPVVLITGAAGDTGVRIGMTLLASGWRVAAADKDVAALGRWAAALREQTRGRFHAVQVDLASEMGCADAVHS
jgi:NAD(P)-dependent dehydrogenase (short-subunit alcohol dehydrogenase family)